jgi:hypothetical protein
MEFIVRKLDILQEVGLTQGAVEKKTTIPILANLLLDAGQEKLHLAATNLDLGIKTSCAAKVENPVLLPRRPKTSLIFFAHCLMRRSGSRNWTTTGCGLSVLRLLSSW